MVTKMPGAFDVVLGWYLGHVSDPDLHRLGCWNFGVQFSCLRCNMMQMNVNKTPGASNSAEVHSPFSQTKVPICNHFGQGSWGEERVCFCCNQTALSGVSAACSRSSTRKEWYCQTLDPRLVHQTFGWFKLQQLPAPPKERKEPNITPLKCDHPINRKGSFWISG